MNHRTKVWLSLSLLFVGETYGGSQIIKIDPNSRLEASIARDYLNRIAASNDRITQVFGDEASYAIQVDENKGQIFIKPSEANGLKPISLTIITEMGQVQDLTLQPNDKGASTIVLKGEKQSQETGAKLEASGQFLETPLPVQEKMIRAMKMLISGQFPALDSSHSSDRNCPDGFSMKHKGSYQVGPFKGHSYEITNTTETLIEADEKSFYRVGDLALSLEKHVLGSQKSMNFWVIER